MRGDKTDLQNLSAALKNELTAINHYFLAHAVALGRDQARSLLIQRVDRRNEARRHVDRAHTLS
jgi:bacterioferritin (cytochrome b1)